ncbi:Binding-protein-dependent transport systems inner membrane component [Thermobacillus xylanilyticus]|jgi:ABC-type glycerol-3-phosphate transport system permease component|uniref:Binding-protein-dependent transport systems inner membrane component n=1 Tax=Thermobacillus xylanilyticus TaxID=76633 RepID=A0ABN7RJK0_THEXY|nr:carbohydrate ABC transporter permease [Thermobacillus xylanilyticus]CAG5076570.1 Binding-protein-dependent transport systems inner membrane component [Thermobacillus xylanilyticus]
MRIRASSVLNHAFMIAFSFIMIYPVIWWIGASLKKTEELRLPTIWPEVPIWENYTKGWEFSANYTFGHFFANTLLMEVGNVVGGVLTAAVVAFGFARLNFPLRGFWFSLMMLTLMLPGQVTIVPQYILYNTFGFVDSYVPLVLPHFFGGGAFFIFLLVQFIRGIPRDLDEAAKIDGASIYGIFGRIIFPLIKPALVTVGIFTFIWSWDDFFSQMLYLSSVDKFTVGLALRMFIDQFEVQWGQLLAMSLLSIVPSVLIFFFAQKHFVEGIATTGLKG